MERCFGSQISTIARHDARAACPERAAGSLQANDLQVACERLRNSERQSVVVFLPPPSFPSNALDAGSRGALRLERYADCGSLVSTSAG